LLAAALEPDLPRTFGGYELLRRLGEGGMGVVFEAEEKRTHRRVALKMIRSGELATEQERVRFRREAEAASRLEHPNIVTIFSVSDSDERSHFTMRLITGGQLEQLRDTLRKDARATARLVATVARAVHHGHERGIIHRDLKPANILIDERGEPQVADFGIAKMLGERDETRTLGLLGTPSYMSPEQAGLGAEEVTTRSDVYSLGAILYDLLTGRPPHEGSSPAAVLESVRSASPPSPRKLDATIPRALEDICLTCLDPTPARRYSAEQLADQLDRFLNDLPIHADRFRPWRRAGLWALRHPAATGLAATIALLFVILSVAAFFVPRALEVQLRREALEVNRRQAHALAGLAMAQVTHYRAKVESWARSPKIIERLGGPRCGRFDAEIETAAEAEKFVSMGLWDEKGMRVARWPWPEEPLRCDLAYTWTDHFQGAALHAAKKSGEGYVSRVSRSEVTGRDKITISAPVFDATGAWRGVVYASFGVDPMVGQFPIDPMADPLRTNALLSRRDITRPSQGQPLPRDFYMLVHNGVQQGAALAVASPALDLLPVAPLDADQTRLSNLVVVDEAYRDPVPSFEGRWLAAFAPVGSTNFAVVVQTRYSAITEQIDDFARKLALWAGLPFLIGATLINLGLFLARRRRSPQ
jgi:eukaryotic-like serine/threonine-protein kinase